jgi:putative transposase
MAIDLNLIDKLLADYKKPEDIIGEHGLLKQLTKAVLERAMQAEMTEHLGYEKHDQAGNNSGNSRNGKTTKALKGDFGEVPLETPRDRNGTFEPKIVAKGQTRFTGFDDKIVSMYARGMSTREITGHLEEIYGVEVSPTLISSVTESVLEEVKIWQGRPLDAIYPIVYLDALYVKVRDAGHVRNRAIYVAIGVSLKGHKEVLGLWTGEAEGAKFWLHVLTDLKNRGVADIFIACVDGLTGFPKAIETVFPLAQVQLCIVHQVRASLNYVSWKQRKAVAGDLQTIYRASTAEEASCQQEAFAEKWDGAYPTISQMWRRNWEHVTPFIAYPADIRKVIYTTNAIESLNMSLRKVIKTSRLLSAPG